MVFSVDRIDSGLAAAMPEITAMTVKVGSAQKSLGKSLEDLTRRDQEVSDKLKASFAQIDSELEKVKVQAATVSSMQQGNHTVVTEQKHELEKMKVDVREELT